MPLTIAWQAPAPPWEAELDVYPLGDAGGDPGWAIKIVKVWIAIGVGAVVFIFWLLVMGLVYD